MPCACGKKSQRRWEVVTTEGKVVFDSASQPTAQTVSRRYPGSKVQEAAKANQ